MDSLTRNIISKAKIKEAYLIHYPAENAKGYVQGMIDFARKYNLITENEKRMFEEYSKEEYSKQRISDIVEYDLD